LRVETRGVRRLAAFFLSSTMFIVNRELLHTK
jgi:hypothetical protein